MTTTITSSSCQADPTNQKIEIQSVWIRSISLSPTEASLMTGVSRDVSWHIPPSEPQITLHPKFSVAVDTLSTVIGGVLEPSCLSVKLAGHRSVPRIRMTPIARSSIGDNPSTFQMMCSWVQRPKTSLEGQQHPFSFYHVNFVSLRLFFVA